MCSEGGENDILIKFISYAPYSSTTFDDSAQSATLMVGTVQRHPVFVGQVDKIKWNRV